MAGSQLTSSRCRFPSLELPKQVPRVIPDIQGTLSPASPRDTPSEQIEHPLEENECQVESKWREGV